jgi:hypothetical protein
VDVMIRKPENNPVRQTNGNGSWADPGGWRRGGQAQVVCETRGDPCLLSAYLHLRPHQTVIGEFDSRGLFLVAG